MSRGMPVGFGSNRQIEESVDYRGSEKTTHNTLICMPLEPVFERLSRGLPHFMDEPTKGIDVGSKSEIYQIICDLAKKGIGVIVVSSELPEIMGVCDRIIVMCQGRVTGELMRETATDEKILTLAMADMLGGVNS